MNVRFPDQLHERLKTFAEAQGSSLNGLICNAVDIYLSLQEKLIYEGRSWRLGESVGYRGSATWLEERASFFQSAVAGKVPQEVISELRWAAKVMRNFSKEVREQFEPKSPFFVNYQKEIKSPELQPEYNRDEG